LVDERRKALKEKYREQKRNLDKEEELLGLLPSLIDERFMPKIHVLGPNLATRLGYVASLHFGDQDPWDDIEPYVTDTEVSILMEQYPPIPMAMRDSTFKRFVPTTQALWDSYWQNNIVDNPNGTTTEFHPVAPFTFNMETAPHSTKTLVKWFSDLGPYTVVCVAHLNPAKDPSYFRTGFAYNPTRVVLMACIPQLGGTYTQISWATGQPISRHKTHGSYTFYWGWPSADDMEWGNVIDFTPRNEVRE
jgi:hypothetical protein